jgi:RNA-splicing ligase RtcB
MNWRATFLRGSMNCAHNTDVLGYIYAMQIIHR